MDKEKKRENASLTKYFVCGGIGGLLNIFLGYPMDTLKVKLQTMPLPAQGEQPLYTGMTDCFIKTIKLTGFKSLYKGMSVPLTVGVPVHALHFYGFYLGKELLLTHPDNAHTMAELFAAGTFSGIFASILTAPSEHVKCILQARHEIDPSVKQKGPVGCLKQLYIEGGIRNVFKGTIATILRDGPANGMFFMSYEVVKDVIVSADASPGKQMVGTIFAGGLSGALYWVVGMPADVLKTRLQSSPYGKYPNGLRDVFKQLMAHEGPGALYTGLVPVMLRAFPTNAATFIGFELGAKLYDWITLHF